MPNVSTTAIILVVLIVPLVLMLIYYTRSDSTLPFVPEGLGKSTLHIGRTAITYTVAETAEERTQGLSGRRSLGVNEGLLFVFPNVGAHGIWMKDMQFPIDIIWIDDNLRIVDIKADARPESYPEVFYPRESARYVLEVNALFAEIKGIRVGDTVDLPEKDRWKPME